MGLTAINRYFRICKSEQQYKKFFSPGKSRTWLACGWFVVALYAVVPKLVGLQNYAFVPGYGICALAFPSYAGKIINYCIVLSLFLAIPLAITMFSYTKVALVIRQHNSTSSSTTQNRGNARITSREIRLSKSLFFVVFAFMMCWAPFWLIIISKRFRLVTKMPRNAQLFCLFLLYLSNTINPFICAGMNPVFRRESRKILFCQRRRRIGLSTSTGA